jgi:transcriptional regulator with XRE-family HTH domain
MAKTGAKSTTPPVMMAARVLQTTPHALARRLGASARTGTRWKTGRSTPSPAVLTALAREVFPLDKGLAATLATAAGESLETLFPRPSPTAVALADAVVCAAADAMQAAPSAVRPALVAALARAKSLNLTLEALAASLTAAR